MTNIIAGCIYRYLGNNIDDFTEVTEGSPPKIIQRIVKKKFFTQVTLIESEDLLSETFKWNL